VPNATTSITVTPTVAQANMTVTVNGTSVTSGTASGSVSLAVGTNTITVVVTAQDGVTVRNYTVAVTRPAAVPTATTVAATLVLGTTATLNASINPGGYADAFFQYGTSTNSGLSLVLAQAGVTGSSAVSANLPLTGLLPGATYYYRAVATNTAGTANGVYLSFTTISTNASLSGLALSGGTLAPTFAASTVSYTASVPNTTTNITVTPTAAQANATITVNGTTVTSGSASEPVSLALGPNTITVVVTAQDAVTVRSYTVAVTRQPPLPVATTVAASAILSTGATLNASIIPNGSADAYFAYGTNTSSGLVVSTLAGSGTGGFADGTGAAAMFNNPISVVMDASGTAYVADRGNNRIRKVSPAGVVTTLAGSGEPGFANGSGATAQFNNPSGVAVDAGGTNYVADQSNQRIRKVSPEGVVTTLAGSYMGLVNGNGEAARFDTPMDVAVDASGTVYVADQGNNCIRKITAAGDVTTLAGSATKTSGFTDGNGAAARFQTPRGVAVDASGNVYVADYGNNCIRKITAAGEVTTLAGTNTASFADGTGAAARFDGPASVAVDASGNVYVADRGNNRIRKVSPAGVVTTLAGSGTLDFADGPATSAMFKNPSGVAVDADGNVYVADYGNHRIRKIGPGPLPLVLAQSGLTGTSELPANLPITGLLPGTTYYYAAVASNAVGTVYGSFLTFTTPSTNASLSGLALSGGTLAPAFAASTVSYTATVPNATTSITVTPTVAQANATITVNGNNVTSGTASGSVSLTLGVNTIAVVVTAQDGMTTKGYTVAVTLLPAVPTATTVAATAILSTGATLHSTINPGGYADAFFQLGTSTNAGVVVSTFAGSGTGGFADGTGAAAQFNAPNGVALDSAGNTYVADNSNNRIRKITPAGVVTTLAGSGTAGFADGTGTAAQFNVPNGVAVDSAGTVYVADNNNNRIRKITPAGVVTTLAGTNISDFADGTGTAAHFRNPAGVAVDSAGSVYVGDSMNNRIRKITSAGVVTTLAGTNTGAFANGTGAAAQFNYPYGVAVDASGNVYVADAWNHCIRQVTPAGVVTTLAGTNSPGFADGTGAAARFKSPAGVVVDASGNIYVVESTGQRIRQVTPAGVVTTLAGTGYPGFADGPGASAKFNYPAGVAVDASGNVYVGDEGNNRIRKLATGSLSRVLAQAGLTGTDPVPVSLSVTGLLPGTTYYYSAVTTNTAGTAYGDFLSFTTLSTNASLSGLVLSGGTLAPTFAPSTVSYTASVPNSTISITVTPTGAQDNMTVTVNGTPVTSGSTSGPVSLVVGPNTITVVVTAQDGFTVRNYTVAVTRLPEVPTATTVAATAIGSTGATLNSTNNPGGYADAFFQCGTSTNPAVVVSTLVGGADYGYVDGSAAVALMMRPQLLAVDAGGNIYFADMDISAIRKVAPDGSVSTLAGSATRGSANGSGSAAQFNLPWGVAVDAAGTVYVADTYNSRIRKITAGGEVTTLAGNVEGFADGTGATARFKYPVGIAVGPDGNIYVGDSLNNSIRKVTPDGVVTTLAGSATPGFADGTGTGASFNAPYGLALDGATNVYVADNGNNSIRKVTPAGVVTTLAGNGSAGFVDGQGTAAQFRFPYGVAVDTSGNLFVGDAENNRIRKITPGGVVTTFAGSGARGGFQNGPVLQAIFDHPNGVAFDAAGNLYVTDQNNYCIRKIVAPLPLVLLLAQAGLTGTDPVPVSLPITGLLPGTTYYYSAVTTNLAGTAYGGFLTFTTLSTNASLARLALSAGTLSPTFASNTVSYTASVPNSTTSIRVTPTGAQANATVKVNDTSVTSGSLSGPVSLVVGTNTITVVVTAQDGVTVRNYTVAVTRLPAVPTATTMAATSVLGTTATLNASINPGGYADAFFQYGTSTNSGLSLVLAQAGLTGTSAVSANLPLTGLLPGATYYYRAVTTNTAGTANGVFLSFTTISTNASLSGLALSGGTLAPTFAASTVSYTASVANSTTSITVTPTVTQANATVTVNGTSVTSGTASGSISLPVGPNTITVAVTAQDGVTVQNYTVAVTRLALAPAVTTVAATGIASNAVVLQALLTAYESTSGLLFEYGTSTNSGPLPLVFAQSGIGGASPTAGNLSVSNLVPETTYYFRGVGTNVAGTGYGAFLSFRTLAINRAPVLVAPITNQSAIYNAAFGLTFPAGTFVDPDGNALTYTATGLPPGISFTSGTRTFAGAPTAIGSYSVSLVASDGQVPPLSATNSFAINVAQAQAIVDLAALSQTYSGTGRAATTATTPTNLAVVVTYNGGTNLPVAAGNYTVIATVDEVNYFGSATNTLVVAAKALNLTASADSKTYGQIKTYGPGQTAFSSGAGELV
ncbi:MAG: cadherin-like beta sandwich domain-containing protein, partial [Verrucomicrobiota bacterium]